MESHSTTDQLSARPAHRAEAPKRRGRLRAFVAAMAALSVAAAISPPSHAQTFKVLYRFGGYPVDGSSPLAGLLMDPAGNLFGTTRYGGTSECSGGSGIGCGTVFKLDTSGAETVLHNFSGPDGANPEGSLIMDAAGNLYGTTEYGGLLPDCTEFGKYGGCGVVFKLSGGTETVLHRFTGGADGALPLAGVIMDRSGALYGTTSVGGKFADGVAFKLAGKKETVLHTFAGYDDGGYISSGLIMGAKADLYGTAFIGGVYGGGVVFKLVGKHETVLHAFDGPPDGAGPFRRCSLTRAVPYMVPRTTGARRVTVSARYSSWAWTARSASCTSSR